MARVRWHRSEAGIRLPDNYLFYCRLRGTLHFNKKYNWRKTLVLYELSQRGHLTAKQLYNSKAGVGCGLISLMAELWRLEKYGYISSGLNPHLKKLYRLKAKGRRFVWAAKRLAPFTQWVSEAENEITKIK